MAEIIGNLATSLEARTGRVSEDEYFTFRFAENSGRGDKRRTTWYDIRAFIPQTEADLLTSGDLVRIRGRLEPQAFVKKKVLKDVPVPKTWDEIIKVLKEREALGCSIVALSSDIKPHQFKTRAQPAHQTASAE